MGPAVRPVAGPVLPLEHLAGHFEPVQPGHLDVQEDQVGGVLVDQRQGVDAVGRLGHDGDAAGLLQQVAQLVTGELFVVDDEGLDAPCYAEIRSGAAMSGISSRTDVPTPATLCRCSWQEAP